MMNERMLELYKQAFGYFPAPTGEPELEKFAALIIAAEREACAKLCEETASQWFAEYTWACEACAEAIRLRGEE